MQGFPKLTKSCSHFYSDIVKHLLTLKQSVYRLLGPGTSSQSERYSSKIMHGLAYYT